MITEKKGGLTRSAKQKNNGSETLDSVQEEFKILGEDENVDEFDAPAAEALGANLADMKNILGYLNQSEWTSALSIGSIMQL